MDWNSLSSTQQNALANILARTCTSAEINQAIAISFRPNDRLATLTARDARLSREETFRAQLRQLVGTAATTNRLKYFVDEMRRIKLGHVAFRNLADLLDVPDMPVSVSRQPGFEFQGAANLLGIVDFEDLLRRMAEIKEATCRFVVSEHAGGDPRSLGTGILVGDDLVLTNHHVLGPFIRQDIGSGRNAPPSATLTCEFDYAGPVAPNGGAHTSIALAANENWVVDISPVDQGAAARGEGQSSAERLDYVLVRLAGVAPFAGGKRRQFEKPIAATEVRNGLPIMVVHYPGQDPLSASFGKTVGMQADDTRVRYDADTEKGTSGSGVYRLPDCSLICLHQGADRDAGYNQGIPIGRILAHRQRQMA